MSDHSYFVRIRGRVLGPYNVEQLSLLRNRGQFSRAHEVSTDRTVWQSASTLEVVFGHEKARTDRLAVSARTRDPENAGDSAVSASGPPSRIQQPVWHYGIGEEQYGPVTLLHLRGMVASGELTPDDVVWKEGLADWVAVSDVSELNSTLRQAVQNSSAPKEPLPANAGAHSQFCFACGSAVDQRAEICPSCGVRQASHAVSQKNRTSAALFALFLGGIRAHHFYLGNILLGLIYLFFCWTFIPAIASLIEGIVFLCMSDATFNSRYGARR